VAKLLAIKGDRLVDTKNLVVHDDAVVLVESGTGKIKAVGWRGNPVAIPPDAEVQEFTGCTLIPGMMDIHMHTAAFNALTFQNYRVATFEVTPQLQQMYALFHAQLCFEMGITTIRDLGWISYAGQLTPQMVAVRDAIDAGIVPGPRLKVAGWAVITGSHLDLILPRTAPRASDATADGPWELRKLARKNLRLGCDVIKTCVSGGGGTDKEEPDVRNMTQEELDAIVDEAHAFGKTVACHTFTPLGQKMAVRAGVDTIDHCVFTDDEAIAMMKEADKIVVPTLAHRTDHAIELRRETGTPGFVLSKMKSLQPYCEETFYRFREAGLRMAMGTDTQFDPEMGANAAELEIYVKYGMTPVEALQTATYHAAQALHLQDQLGSLESGKLADVVAVKGDVTKDIRLLQERENIWMVMKEGKVYVDRRPGHRLEIIHNREWKKPV
jgi:imidazolonepropionase-like amidohydrolase